VPRANAMFAFDELRGRDTERDNACVLTRRYRLQNMTFHTRSPFLDEADPAWDDADRALHEENRRSSLARLRHEFGELNIKQVVDNARALGDDPWSVLAWHNGLWVDISRAFIGGSYYSAGAAAGALAERIVNHMMIDLAQKVQIERPKDATFEKVIDVLDSWTVLEDGVTDELHTLRKLRNSFLHFDPSLYSELRTRSLELIHQLRDVINHQFGIVPRWLIPDAPGVLLLRRAVESEPFIATYVLPTALHVGPRHELAFDPPSQSWSVINDLPVDVDKDTDEVGIPPLDGHFV
jgi:hypothetical protein